MDSASLRKCPSKNSSFLVYLVPGLDVYLDDGLPGLVSVVRAPFGRGPIQPDP